MPKKCNVRVHHSHAALTKVSFPEQQKTRSPKPEGLWYEMTGGAWGAFLEPAGRGGRRDAGDFSYQVVLRRGAHIAKLSTAAKVRGFTAEYGVSVDIGDGELVMMVNWAAVSEDFDGVEFCPYLYEIRMEDGLDWYSTVDVDSGCVWSADAVSRVARLK